MSLRKWRLNVFSGPVFECPYCRKVSLFYVKATFSQNIVFCAHCLFFCHWTPMRNQFLFPLFLPIGYLDTWIKSCQAFSSLGYTVPDLSAHPPCMKGTPVLWLILLCFTGLSPVLSISVLYGGPRTEPIAPDAWVEKDPLPWPAGSAFPNATQQALGLLCCKCTLMPRDELDVHQNPNVLHSRVAFQVISPQPVLMISVRPPQLQDWHFPLLNLLRYVLAHCSTLTRVPLNKSTPIWWSLPSRASSADLLRMGSVLLSRSLWRC